MLQQGNGGAFGRRPLAGAPLIAAPPKPPAAAPSNPIVKFFDRVFLWLPNEQSPGFLAVCLYLVRQTLLPIALLLAPYAVLALFAPANFNPLQHSSTSPNWYVVLIVPFALACIALVQELSRYAFVRRANNPVRAVSIFTAVVIASLLIVYHDSLYTCAWTIAAQLAASAAIIYALRYRPYIHAAVVGLIICQTAVNVTAPGLFQPPQAAATHTQPAKVSASVPSTGNMQAWAKLYPGAVLTKNETSKFMNLTEWSVEYTVQVSPDQIGGFYQTLANAEGFSNTQVILGYHRFTQDSTNNDFSYMVTTDATGSHVIFDARTFASAVSPG